MSPTGMDSAVAAGMMTAASISLFWEGVAFTEPHDTSEISTHARTAIGAVLGLFFILGTKGILDRYEDLKVAGMDGTDARKALLVFFVMTLHSFSEGVGIGVSFGGTHGSELGSTVGCHARLAFLARNRGGIDDSALTGCLEGRQRCLRHQEDTLGVHRKNSIPGFLGEITDGARIHHTGIVYQYIQSAEP